KLEMLNGVDSALPIIFPNMPNKDEYTDVTFRVEGEADQYSDEEGEVEPGKKAIRKKAKKSTKGTGAAASNTTAAEKSTSPRKSAFGGGDSEEEDIPRFGMERKAGEEMTLVDAWGGSAGGGGGGGGPPPPPPPPGGA